MTFLHDKFPIVKPSISTLTERGQVSVPASIRKGMRMHRGQRLRWEKISETECRLLAEPAPPAGPLAVLGYGPKLRGGKSRRTADWIRELREGDKR